MIYIRGAGITWVMPAHYKAEYRAYGRIYTYRRPRPLHTPLLDREYGLDHKINKGKGWSKLWVGYKC
jgi:hypothetical protein